MGWRASDMFIPLSQQEMAAQNQPSPQDLLKLQMQRERMSSIADTAQEKHAADLTKELLMHSVEQAGEEESEKKEPVQ